MIKGLLKGFIPFPMKGSMLTLPVDILVERNEKVQTAYYANDEGDHLVTETILKFLKQ